MTRDFQTWLTSRSLPYILAGIAMALNLPALWIGLQFDDYLHEHVILSLSHLPPVLMTLFKFLPSEPEVVLDLMEKGILPWWTLPQISIAFWRPVTAFTHWVDYQLWPQWPALMHVHSIVWFGGLIVVTTMLYRQLETGWIAGLAALLYAIDEAHALPVDWLANRNGIIATLFGFLTIWAYDRWRRLGWKSEFWLTPFFLLLALLSAEGAIATLGYLIAYLICLDKDTWSQRVVALGPSLAVVFGWLFLYHRFGYGTWGTAYVSPFQEPFRYLALAFERAPILLLNQFLIPSVEIYNFLAPPLRDFVWWGAIGSIGIIGLILWPMLKSNSMVRFWSLGMILALPPACVILPAGRLLFFVGLGGMAIIAHFLIWLRDHTSRNRLYTGVGYLFVLSHLAIAPLLLVLNPSFILWFAGDPQLPTDISPTVVIINAPSPFHASSIPFIRNRQGQTGPERIRLLTSSPGSVMVKRLDERTLLIRPQHGYFLGLDTVFRGQGHHLALFQQIVLSDMSVQVTALTEDGRPAEATFHFQRPLEDSSLQWFQWQMGRYQPFTLPVVGETVSLNTL